MRVLHFSYSDHYGGAAKGAYRVHRALLDRNCDSRMIVCTSGTHDPAVRQEAPNRLRLVLHRTLRSSRVVLGAKPTYFFNGDVAPVVGARRLEPRDTWRPEVVCLFWTTGMVSTRTLGRVLRSYSCPVVIVPLDMEPFTGGCHYSFGCTRFEDKCGRCPQLGAKHDGDRSRVILSRKHDLLARHDVGFVAATGWLAGMLERSSLGRHRPKRRISLPIDVDTFSPGSKLEARERWGIPRDRMVIGTGAFSIVDRRKGADLLQEALRIVAGRAGPGGTPLRRSDLFVAVGGHTEASLGPLAGLAGKWVRDIPDEPAMASFYRACDVFVSASVEDAGPMMVPEAMLCGTPVVAFPIGGAPDVIRDQDNGALAGDITAASLAAAIESVLVLESRTKMGAAARQAAVAAHEPRHVAEEHVEFYSSIIDAVIREGSRRA